MRHPPSRRRPGIEFTTHTAAAALGATPHRLLHDVETLGLLLESLVLRESITAEDAGSGYGYGHDACDRLAASSDDDLGTGLDLAQQLREVRLRLAHTDFSHPAGYETTQIYVADDVNTS